jgi:hypothetical protein
VAARDGSGAGDVLRDHRRRRPPEHAHGAQWGVVLEGAIDFTIDGETRTYSAGDTYFVPDGAAHSAVIHPGYVGIDVFADADRYGPRGRAGTGQEPLASSAAEG